MQYSMLAIVAAFRVDFYCKSILREREGARERGRKKGEGAESCHNGAVSVRIHCVAAICCNSLPARGSITISPDISMLQSRQIPMHHAIYSISQTKTDSTRCSLFFFSLSRLDDAINEMSSSFRVLFFLFYFSSSFSLFCAWFRFVRSFVLCVLFTKYAICTMYARRVAERRILRIFRN